LLLAGCGLNGLRGEPGMPPEQQVSLVTDRVVLAPRTQGASEAIVAFAAAEAARADAALRAPGGLAAETGRAAAETAYQQQVGPGLNIDDPFTRFGLVARRWLAAEVDAGRVTPAQAQVALARVLDEVALARARRENFAPAAPFLRRVLWAAAPGTTMESLQRETALYREHYLQCPSERSWGTVSSTC
jgi:hypothetical protein